MKIFYFISKSEIGGAQTHVVQLVSYFVSKGHQVAVMSYPGGWLEKEVTKLGASFVPNYYFGNNLNPIRMYKAMAVIRRAIKLFTPDIITCHSSVAGILVRLVVRNRIPTIFTAHGWSFEIGVPVWQRVVGVAVEKLVSRFTEKIICVSDYVRKHAVSNNIAPADKFVVIYNGLPEVKSVEKKQNQMLRLLYVGRLARPKQPMLLLKAVTLLPFELRSNIVITIVGYGPMRMEIDSFLKNNAELQVEIKDTLGPYDVESEYAAADIFVLPTQWEAISYAIIQAMRAALPVVASNVGGISEAVDKNTGFLVSSGDVRGFQRSLEILIADAELRERMGNSARQKFSKLFLEKQMLDQTESVYNSALQNRGAV